MKNRLRVLMAEKAHKENRRVSLRIMAQETGVSIHTLRSLSSGKLREISLDNLQTLANYFQCGLDDLFEVESKSNCTPDLAAA
jgi:putative transcriptional regulator